MKTIEKIIANGTVEEIIAAITKCEDSYSWPTLGINLREDISFSPSLYKYQYNEILKALVAAGEQNHVHVFDSSHMPYSYDSFFGSTDAADETAHGLREKIWSLFSQYAPVLTPKTAKIMSILEKYRWYPNYDREEYSDTELRSLLLVEFEVCVESALLFVDGRYFCPKDYETATNIFSCLAEIGTVAGTLVMVENIHEEL